MSSAHTLWYREVDFDVGEHKRQPPAILTPTAPHQFPPAEVSYLGPVHPNLLHLLKPRDRLIIGCSAPSSTPLRRAENLKDCPNPRAVCNFCANISYFLMSLSVTERRANLMASSKCSLRISGSPGQGCHEALSRRMSASMLSRMASLQTL